MKAGQHQLMRQVEDEHWWYRVLRGQVVRALSRMVPEGWSLLDAGCGTGGMLSWLRGWEAHGCEIAAEAVEHCRARGLQPTLTWLPDGADGDQGPQGDPGATGAPGT